MKKISIIAAMTKDDQVIGQYNTIPWNLPEDLIRFKKLTVNNTVIMGHKTYISIGKPLSNRQNIVLTKDIEYKSSGVEVAHSIEEAINLSKKDIFVIGGENVYRQFLDISDTLYITWISASIKGDSYFPEINFDLWDIIKCESFSADIINQYNMLFCKYRKNNGKENIL